MIATEGLSAEAACRVLGVSCAGYYAWRCRAPSARAIRHAWLTDLIGQIHTVPRGTYGAPRVRAELVLGMGISVGHNAVAMLMRRAGHHHPAGRTSRTKPRDMKRPRPRGPGPVANVQRPHSLRGVRIGTTARCTTGVGLSPPVDIWDKLSRSIELTATPTAAADPKAAAAPKKMRWWRRIRRARVICDAVGSLLWVWLFLKIFVADVDQLAVERIAPGAQWVVDYRGLIYLTLLIIAVVFLGKKHRLWMIFYVIGFPFVVLFWKIPLFIVRRKSWPFAIGSINFIASTVRDFKYNVVSKGSAVIAGVLILVTDNATVNATAAIYIGGLLLVSYGRTVSRSVQPTWFLKLQKDGIEKVTDEPVPFFGAIDEKYKGDSTEFYDKEAVTAVALSMSMGVMVTQGLYFWAYQLDRYRQTAAGFFLSALSYLWLFFGTVLSLALLNEALFHVAPDQFDGASAPSFMATILYATGTLAFTELGHVNANGDAAYAFQLVGGILGLVLLATLVTNLVLVVRREKDVVASKELVVELRRRARAQGEALRAEYGASVAETMKRLVELRAGFWQVFGFMASAVPEEFFDDEDHDMRRGT